jgi:hypothetical protein
MKTGDLFTAPWPGPGDSEGPVDPEPAIGPITDRPRPGRGPEGTELPLISTAPWPGPGDSEGPVQAEASSS